MLCTRAPLSCTWPHVPAPVDGRRALPCQQLLYATACTGMPQGLTGQVSRPGVTTDFSSNISSNRDRGGDLAAGKLHIVDVAHPEVATYQHRWDEAAGCCCGNNSRPKHQRQVHATLHMQQTSKATVRQRQGAVKSGHRTSGQQMNKLNSMFPCH